MGPDLLAAHFQDLFRGLQDRKARLEVVDGEGRRGRVEKPRLPSHEPAERCSLNVKVELHAEVIVKCFQRGDPSQYAEKSPVI